MGILRTDRVSGLGGANAIKGSVFFGNDGTSGTTKGTSLNIVDANDKADLNFAGNDFTFEAWVFPSNNIAWNLLYGQSWGLQIYIDTSGTGKVKVYVGSNDTGSYAISGAESANGTINADAWNHVAFSRSGNSWTIFTNGTAATSSTSSQSLVSSDADYTIGIFNSIGSGNDAGSYYGFNGFISNLRIRTGAHYLPSTNFTPPVGELQKTSDTVLLACQSPGDITKEATGKTLVPTSKNLNDALPQASHFTPNSPVGFSTTTDVGTQFGSTFDGVTTFDSQAYMVVPGGNTRERNRGRALLGGGHSGSGATNHIHQLSIQSQGNTEDFGDLTYVRWIPAPSSSSTRGVWSGGGGYNPGSPTGSYVNFIDFVTIANSSNATDFGDQTAEKGYHAGLSNETRGIIAGGYNDSVGKIDVIEFITIATAGNAQDFGDLTGARSQLAATGSPTRGLFFGGAANPNVLTNVVDFITIATTGNALDFGDLSDASRLGTGFSNSIRGFKATGDGQSGKIDLLTIATLGNAVNFGSLSQSRDEGGGMASPTRGVIAGGYTPTTVNTIDYISLQTGGDAVDFGDLSAATSFLGDGATSNAHGGL